MGFPYSSDTIGLMQGSCRKNGAVIRNSSAFHEDEPRFKLDKTVFESLYHIEVVLQGKIAKYHKEFAGLTGMNCVFRR